MENGKKKKVQRIMKNSLDQGKKEHHEKQEVEGKKMNFDQGKHDESIN